MVAATNNALQSSTIATYLTQMWIGNILQVSLKTKLTHVDPIFRMKTKRLSDKLIILGNRMELGRNFSV